MLHRTAPDADELASSVARVVRVPEMTVDRRGLPSPMFLKCNHRSFDSGRCASVAQDDRSLKSYGDPTLTATGFGGMIGTTFVEHLKRERYHAAELLC
jgi:hypothetical protein